MYLCTLIYYIYTTTFSVSPQLSVAIIIEMDNLGIHDFKNKIQEGSVVDLSQTTVTFCRLIFGYVNDTMRIYVPELLLGFIDCFCDIFRYMVDLYVDAFNRDENVPVSDFIVADALFIIETLLPTVGNSINTQTGVQIPDFVDLHDRYRPLSCVDKSVLSTLFCAFLLRPGTMSGPST